MKNKKIFLFDILILIVICFILLTASFKNKLSSQMFDNLMILYGTIIFIVIVLLIITVIKLKK
jgi:magnesium-transporting ATPase (P-type)